MTKYVGDTRIITTPTRRERVFGGPSTATRYTALLREIAPREEFMREDGTPLLREDSA